MSKFQSYQQFFEAQTILPSKEELEVFHQMIDDGCKAVEELWKTGRFYNVIFRCGAVDYRYQWVSDALTQYPHIKDWAMKDGLDRLKLFILDGKAAAENQWGKDATLMMFRATEKPASTGTGKFTQLTEDLSHYKFEYDWNPETSQIELIDWKSGQQFDDKSSPQLNQEAGKIAGVIYEHICKPYRFTSSRGTALGRNLGINL